MQEAGLSKNTINARLVAVNSFYQFVCTRFEVEPGRYLHHFNPATVVQRLHINPYEKAQGLSPEQVRALLKTCDRKTILGARDFALLTFYLYTGRRRSEIARLTWADIRGGSKPNQKEYYYKGKGSKGGWRELPAPVWSAVKSYLKQAGRLTEMEPESPLFVATNDHASRLGKTSDGPIGERTISQVVNRAAKLAGLEHIKVHALRHTAAKLRRRSGASLEEVSQFLDHSSIATTQIYLGAVEAKEDIGWKKIEALIGLEGEVEEEV
jgi:integrase